MERRPRPRSPHASQCRFARASAQSAHRGARESPSLYFSDPPVVYCLRGLTMGMSPASLTRVSTRARSRKMRLRRQLSSAASETPPMERFSGEGLVRELESGRGPEPDAETRTTGALATSRFRESTSESWGLPADDSRWAWIWVIALALLVGASLNPATRAILLEIVGDFFVG